MWRVTEHTRRSERPLPCALCAHNIAPGDRYRQLVAIREDWADADFLREAAHVRCAARHEAWDIRLADNFSPSSLDHIRSYYRLPWVRMGARIRFAGEGRDAGKVGEILGGSGPHLVIRWDGEKRHAPYHARDVLPEVARAA